MCRRHMILITPYKKIADFRSVVIYAMLSKSASRRDATFTSKI